MADLYQVAQLAARQFGLRAGDVVPTPQEQLALIDKLLFYISKTDNPPSFRYLDQVMQWLEQAAPEAAASFRQQALNNPECKNLLKNIEFTLAALAQRSPETWEHIKHHTVLAAMSFPLLSGRTDVAQALMGTIAHDAGKIFIAPELLHKNQRIAAPRFDYVLQNFYTLVPDYPQKAHDIRFLQEANAGRIVFSEDKTMLEKGGSEEIIDFLDQKRSESAFLTPEMRVIHSRIMGRIAEKAKKALPAGQWFADTELQTLALDRYGTLSEQEKSVIGLHDPMGAAFFARQPLPQPFGTLPDLVNMAMPPADPQTAALRNLIQLCDVFEALTGKRSYRASPYTAAEALRVMDDMAIKGEIDAPLFQQFRQSNIWRDFAQRFGRETGEPAPQKTPMPATERVPAACETTSGWTSRIAAQAAARAAQPVLSV